MAVEKVDITIGGLRTRAFGARKTLCESARSSSEQAEINLEFVQAMALVQIAQEMNEIKHILNSQKK